MFCVIKSVQLLHPASLLFLVIDILIGALVYGVLYFVYGLYSKKNLAGVLVQGFTRRLKRSK